jgi:16S rRNA (cytidine1402-2'-O)-methyltransferase
LERWKSRKETLIFYEAPHRLHDTIRDMWDVLGDRKVAVARELTKRYEELLHGSLSEFHDLLESDSLRGEFVLLVEGASETAAELSEERPWWQELTPSEHVAALVRQGAAKKEAIKQAAKDRNQSKRDIYQAVLAEASVDQD